jgi:hypothetical protein
MNAPLPAWFPLEMFNGICDVNLVAIDSRFLERAFQKHARRPKKWFSSEILLVSRLFTQEHQPRVFWSFAENRLSRVLVKRAGRATPAA